MAGEGQHLGVPHQGQPEARARSNYQPSAQYQMAGSQVIKDPYKKDLDSLKNKGYVDQKATGYRTSNQN